MLAKYGLIGMASLLAVAGARIWFLESKITDQAQNIELLQTQKIACDLAQNNLKEQIERQNQSINQFKETLEQKNRDLATIEEKNEILQKNVKTKINEVNEIRLSTCKDTVNWMLKEAIEIHEDTRTVN